MCVSVEINLYLVRSFGKGGGGHACLLILLITVNLHKFYPCTFTHCQSSARFPVILKIMRDRPCDSNSQFFRILPSIFQIYRKL